MLLLYKVRNLKRTLKQREHIMKKVFMVIGLGFIFTTTAFAGKMIHISGSDARDLYSDMERAGAQKQMYVDASHIGLKNLDCKEGGGVVFLPMHCNFEDAVSGEQKEVSGRDAQALVSDLEEAGLKL